MRFLFPVFSYFLIISPCMGSTEADTALANSYCDMGDSLMTAARYDSAIAYLGKASEIYKSAEIWEDYFISLNKISDALSSLERKEKALSLAQNALELCGKKLGNTHSIYALLLYRIGSIRGGWSSTGEDIFDLLNRALMIQETCQKGCENDKANTLDKIGRLYMYKGEYEKGLSYIQQALKTRQENHLSLERSFYYLGVYYYETSDYLLALKYWKKALKDTREEFGDYHPETARHLSNLSKAYFYIGMKEEAISYVERALEIGKGIYGENHGSVMLYLIFYGYLLEKQGEYNRSIAFINQSLRIARIIKSPHEAGCYFSLARSYEVLGDLDSALFYNHKAMDMRRENFGEISWHVADCHRQLGTIFKSKGLHSESLLNYRKALRIYKKRFGEEHSSVSSCYNNIGLVYDEEGQLDSALYYYQKALKIKKAVHGEKSGHTVVPLVNMGSLYQNKHHYQKALSFYQQALIENFTNFKDTSIYKNPSLEDYIDHYFLLLTLLLKAQTFYEMYEKENRMKDLEFSLETIHLCDTLINKIRQSHLRHGDKVEFAKRALDTYEQALKICQTLYELTGEPTYIQYAFYFAEKSKSAVLRESLSNHAFKQKSYIPDTLQELEKEIKVDIEYQRSLVGQMKSKKQLFDSVRMNNVQNRIFNLSNRLDSLELFLEKNYPEYHRLKSPNNTLSVNEIQQKLSEDQALLSYFEGPSTITIFTLTPSQFKVSHVLKDSIFDDQLKTFRLSFDHKNASDPSARNFHKFTESSYFLYKKLLRPSIEKLSEETNHLIIIPDGKLAYIPWSLMISSQDTTAKKDYRTLGYLFQDYSISYGHSASLLFEDLATERSKVEDEMVAFAPSYADPSDHNNYPQIADNFRDEIVPLNWTTSELDKISQYYRGGFYQESSATERTFKEKAAHSKVLHLAMHALVDNEDPMQSSLIFTPAEDSLEDGLLHTYELFNMDIAAEMVVLSACNTGIGKLQKGEGIMSLGRAFSYAGCRSIVMSHWSVNDESTSEFMGLFYKHLSAGKRKDVALQQARIEYLSKVDNLRQHPLYWGSFIVLGNTDPISKADRSMYIYLSLFVLLLGIMAYFMIRQRRTSSKPSI